MSRRRIRALLRKELLEVSRHKTSLLPIALLGVYCLLLPFVFTVVIPHVTGDRLSDDQDFVNAAARSAGAYPGLSADARVQTFFFQQFLLVFLVVPVSVAMSAAAHAVVGEKDARTMEPLLATPLTTAELLIAKVLGALLPAMGVGVPGIVLYLASIGLFSETGVLQTMLTWRSAATVMLLGPGLALIALQLTVLIASRVEDEDTARQLAILALLPLGALIFAQFTGRVWLSAATLAAAGVGLIGVWLLLLALSVAVFDRDAVLTRWR
jgi:ABC-2 type transport system permease protein